MQISVLQEEEILGLADVFLYLARRAEHRARKRLAVQQFLVGAFEDDLSALHPRARTHIDDVIGDFDDLLVVLHEDDRVAVIFELLHRLLHQQDVVVVETHAGFVEDVHHVGKGRVDVFGDLATLRLAAGEGTDGAVEGEVAESDLLQCRQPLGGRPLDVLRQRIVDGLHPLAAVADAHRGHLGDVEAADLAGAYLLVEARAAAVGTGAHRQHRVEHGGVEQTLLRVDDAAVHTGDEAFVLGGFGPVGRRVLQLDLRRVEEEVELLGRVVLDFLVEVEEAAVGVAYPPPAALSEGDVVDGVLVVERLVEID